MLFLLIIHVSLIVERKLSDALTANYENWKIRTGYDEGE